jgi:hypothetical protein
VRDAIPSIAGVPLTMRRMTPTRSLPALLARGAFVAVISLVAALGATTGPAHAGAATTCDVRKDGRKLGTTYVTSLRVEHVSCTKAKKVIKAFNVCRKARGEVKGRCERRVLGYRCSEQRGDIIPTQYSARATCKDAGRVVRFRYTQYT